MIYGDFNASEKAILESLLTEEEKEFINKTAPEWSNMEKKAPLYPAYHFTSPHGFLNDPNGLCYWKGYWHLFYQNYLGKVWMWSHAVSRDLVHWKHLPRAILPEIEKDCYSGMVLIEEDRAIAAYYGVDAGIMIAVATDPFLVRWEKINGGHPVIPSTPKESGCGYEIYDPCLWKNGDTYCLISGRYTLNEHTKTKERQGFLFESTDLVHWEFKGNFLENDIFAHPNDDLACPYFLPCGDKHLLFHFSHHSGPKMLVGNYDRARNKFTVTGGKHLTSSVSHIGGLLAPSMFPDPSADGTLKAIYNVYGVQGAPEGYYNNSIMSLPRQISLSADDSNDIDVEPAKELELLRVPESRVLKTDLLLRANETYEPEDIRGNTLELIAEFEPQSTSFIEVRVMMSDDEKEYSAIRIYRNRGFGFSSSNKSTETRETVVQLDTAYSSEKAVIRLPDEQRFFMKPCDKMNLRIFLDNGIIEVFVNGKVALTARVAPTKAGKRISFVSRGKDIMLEKLEAYQLSL